MAGPLSAVRVEEPVFGDLEMPFDDVWWDELESEVQLVEDAVCPVGPQGGWCQSLLKDLVKACCGGDLCRIGIG